MHRIDLNSVIKGRDQARVQLVIAAAIERAIDPRRAYGVIPMPDLGKQLLYPTLFESPSWGISSSCLAGNGLFSQRPNNLLLELSRYTGQLFDTVVKECLKDRVAGAELKNNLDLLMKRLKTAILNERHSGLSIGRHCSANAESEEIDSTLSERKTYWELHLDELGAQSSPGLNKQPNSRTEELDKHSHQNSADSLPRSGEASTKNATRPPTADRTEEKRDQPSPPSPSIVVTEGAVPKLAAARQCVVTPILERRRWTRCKWASEAGVGKNCIYEYLKGTRNPSFENRKAMADALGVPVEQLPN